MHHGASCNMRQASWFKGVWADSLTTCRVYDNKMVAIRSLQFMNLIQEDFESAINFLRMSLQRQCFLYHFFSLGVGETLICFEPTAYCTIKILTVTQVGTRSHLLRTKIRCLCCFSFFRNDSMWLQRVPMGSRESKT